ncbi:MAG: accessory factor UbiK family protein [Legionellaceae bacterium]|nr:accessory factor UbiK family protein [Legionellaceae bacterium]
MPDHSSWNDTLQKICKRVETHLTPVRQEIEESLSILAQSALKSLNLVSRTEFDLQRKVLERTREKLSTLEKAIEKETPP